MFFGIVKKIYYTNNLYTGKAMITTHEKYKKKIKQYFFLIINYITNNLCSVLGPLAKYNFLLATWMLIFKK